MQGVTWHGTVEDHGRGAHSKHERETKEADARPPEPVGTRPQPRSPAFNDDGWKWKETGWRRTEHVSFQEDEDEDEEEEKGGEKRPYDPARAGPN